MDERSRRVLGHSLLTEKLPFGVVAFGVTISLLFAAALFHASRGRYCDAIEDTAFAMGGWLFWMVINRLSCKIGEASQAIESIRGSDAPCPGSDEHPAASDDRDIPDIFEYRPETT